MLLTAARHSQPSFWQLQMYETTSSTSSSALEATSAQCFDVPPPSVFTLIKSQTSPAFKTKPTKRQRLKMHSFDRPPPKSPLPESPTDLGMRSLLVSALNLAREAVQLDTSNDGAKALAKYSESVWALRELLQRMRDHGTSPRTSWAQSVKEQQDEEARLQAILDTYTVRIGVLREAYGIAPGSTLELSLETRRGSKGR